VTNKLDQDLIDYACNQLDKTARQYTQRRMGPASAARAAIRETKALFPADWQLAVQGDDSEDEVEVWEVEHKRTIPCARISRAPALSQTQQQQLAIIQAHGGRVRHSVFGGWLDGVRGLRLPAVKQLVQDGVLAAETARTTRRSTRATALPSIITTYKVV